MARLGMGRDPARDFDHRVSLTGSNIHISFAYVF